MLHPYTSFFFFCFFLGFSFKCSDSPEQNFCNSEIKLGYKENVQLDPDQKARLVFYEVENDSRCPKGAQCIWEGEAVILLQFVTDDKTIDLKFSTLKSNAKASAPNKIDTLGYSVTLKDLSPYPESGKSIDKQDYKATFFIKCNS